MRARSVCLVIALGLLCSSQGWTQETMRQAGKQSFALGIGSAPGDTAVQDTLTLYVLATAARGHGPTREVHLVIPDGLALVSGDTAYTETVAGMSSTRPVRVRAVRPGDFEVRGTLEIVTSPGESDFKEVSLPIAVDGRTLRPGAAVTRRNECTRGSRRFRLAGFWMVPMDEGDVIDNVDFKRNGTRPHVFAAPAATCSRCPIGMADTVAFAVVVDKSGKVAQLEVMGRPHGSAQSPEEIAAAKDVLARWRFQPARLHGRPLNDWCRVSVPVTSE